MRYQYLVCTKEVYARYDLFMVIEYGIAYAESLLLLFVTSIDWFH